MRGLLVDAISISVFRLMKTFTQLNIVVDSDYRDYVVPLVILPLPEEKSDISLLISPCYHTGGIDPEIFHFTLHDRCQKTYFFEFQPLIHSSEVPNLEYKKKNPEAQNTHLALNPYAIPIVHDLVHL